VKRITLKLASGVKMEFTDRDRALAQIAEWAEKSTRWPVVVFGPGVRQNRLPPAGRLCAEGAWV
jgi:hypothetical protein